MFQHGWLSRESFEGSIAESYVGTVQSKEKGRTGKRVSKATKISTFTSSGETAVFLIPPFTIVTVLPFNTTEAHKPHSKHPFQASPSVACWPWKGETCSSL